MSDIWKLPGRWQTFRECPGYLGNCHESDLAAKPRGQFCGNSNHWSSFFYCYGLPDLKPSLLRPLFVLWLDSNSDITAHYLRLWLSASWGGQAIEWALFSKCWNLLPSQNPSYRGTSGGYIQNLRSLRSKMPHLEAFKIYPILILSDF